VNTFEVELPSRNRRRRHSAEFKQVVIGECMKPGVSMASVALRNGLNATMLRKWVIEAERKLAPKPTACEKAPTEDVVPTPAPTFVPLALPAAAVEGDIRIELKRANATVSITWPASSARECAAWLRDWLR